MLITKTNPVGIDLAIQRYQTFLHARLMELWGLDVTIEAQNKLYQCYGRCYRNKLSTGSYMAQVYVASNEYKPVYWDDSLNAISFFGIADSESHATGKNIGETMKVHQVFFVNLEKLKPSIIHRADEEVRKDVQLLALEELFGFKYTSTDIWLENVLKEYPGSIRDNGLKQVDMHPVHCFRLNYELNYNKSIC